MHELGSVHVARRNYNTAGQRKHESHIQNTNSPNKIQTTQEYAAYEPSGDHTNSTTERQQYEHSNGIPRSVH